jgi:hypothetical protein
VAVGIADPCGPAFRGLALVHPILLVLLAVAATPLGRAPLRLQLDKCVDIDQALVSRVVTMELDAGLADDRQSEVIATAKAECADAQVRLTIDDPVTGKSTTRTLELERQPRGVRSRLLGLAISEAVLASWVELQLTREPPPSQPGVTASPEIRRKAADIAERRLQVPRPDSSPAWDIAAGPAVRWFSSGLFTVGLTGGARRWFGKQPTAGVGLELDGSYGERSVARVARADATSLSLAPCLLMRSNLGRLVVTANAGWRVGLAHLSAVPANTLRSGRAAFRGWTGPFLAVEVRVGLWRSISLRASMESGYAIVPARGGVDSVDVIAIDGSWLGGLLSMGTTL